MSLGSVPALPLQVAPGGSLDLVIEASAGVGAGRTESLLAVTTGEVDAPENQVWTVVAETVQ